MVWNGRKKSVSDFAFTTSCVCCGRSAAGETAKQETIRYLEDNVGVKCGSDEAIEPVFWTFFVLWPVLVPLAFFLLVLHVRRSVLSRPNVVAFLLS